MNQKCWPAFCCHSHMNIYRLHKWRWTCFTNWMRKQCVNSVSLMLFHLNAFLSHDSFVCFGYFRSSMKFCWVKAKSSKHCVWPINWPVPIAFQHENIWKRPKKATIQSFFTRYTHGFSNAISVNVAHRTFLNVSILIYNGIQRIAHSIEIIFLVFCSGTLWRVYQSLSEIVLQLIDFHQYLLGLSSLDERLRHISTVATAPQMHECWILEDNSIYPK